MPGPGFPRGTELSEVVPPFILEAKYKDNGTIFFNIMSAENRPVMYVEERYYAAAQELVRLANLGAERSTS